MFFATPVFSNRTTISDLIFEDPCSSSKGAQTTEGKTSHGEKAPRKPNGATCTEIPNTCMAAAWLRCYLFTSNIILRYFHTCSYAHFHNHRTLEKVVAMAEIPKKVVTMAEIS